MPTISNDPKRAQTNPLTGDVIRERLAVMIDLETLSLGPDAAIVQIGVAAANLMNLVKAGLA